MLINTDALKPGMLVAYRLNRGIRITACVSLGSDSYQVHGNVEFLNGEHTGDSWESISTYSVATDAWTLIERRTAYVADNRRAGSNWDI